MTGVFHHARTRKSPRSFNKVHNGAAAAGEEGAPAGEGAADGEGRGRALRGVLCCRLSSQRPGAAPVGAGRQGGGDEDLRSRLRRQPRASSWGEAAWPQGYPERCLQDAPRDPVPGQGGVLSGDGAGRGARSERRRRQGPAEGLRRGRHQHGLQQQEAPRLAPRDLGSLRGEADEVGEEGGRGPVRDRAERHGGGGQRPGRRGGGAQGLPSAGPRGGLPRAVLQDQDLLRHRRRRLGRRLLRQGRRRRPLQPRDAYNSAGQVQGTAQGVRRLHEVRPRSVAKRSEVPLPEYWKFGDVGNKYFRHATGQIYAVSKDLAAYISVNQPILHRFANEDVSVGAWLIGLEVEHVDDRSMCCATPPGPVRVADCEWKKRAGNVCVASYDWSCSGVCRSVDRMKLVHDACGEDQAALWGAAA